MESCEFSETQFSFCYTFEYVRQFLPFVPLPIFPNTVEEGRVGGGYDVEIAGSLYFQFKIPTYHDKVSNFFRKHWDVYGHDYYKIKLNTDGEQFKLLKDLKRLSLGNRVFYATPEFWQIPALSSHYSGDRVLANSALFAIEDLPAHGSGYHHLIYSPRHSLGRLFSDPTDVKKLKNVNPFELLVDSGKPETIYSQARRISIMLRERQFISSEMFELNDNNPVQLVKGVYSILMTHYDIHWFPVISRRQRARF
ncbi:hypothetical protein [Hymenobacter edaphi]|uniref:hypothetical protein n=1 Tax=Hymenobacter edaphi TaxID=2211146 RepID=UPI001057FE67|nr:hypothetical protein [Hymenobacter edaphi]